MSNETSTKTASKEVNKKDVNAVAFTQGPGLLGALLVGIEQTLV